MFPDVTRVPLNSVKVLFHVTMVSPYIGSLVSFVAGGAYSGVITKASLVVIIYNIYTF